MGGQRRSSAVERQHFDSAVDMARALPQHFRPIADTPTLTGEETESLAQCEAAIETLQVAFWAAGKALHIIRDGRLYRATHATFDDYVAERWNGMTRRQADRLIKGWPIAEELIERQSNGSRPIGPSDLNESQIREVVPVGTAHGVQAATFVYRTVHETEGITVTAGVLKEAVKAIPAGDFDEKTAAEAIRNRLADLAGQQDGEDAEPDYAARAQKAVPMAWLRRVVQKDRAGAEAYLDHLQDQIEKARAELLPSE